MKPVSGWENIKEILWLLAQPLAIVMCYVILYEEAGRSPFAKGSMSQYGAFILIAFVAAAVSTGLSFFQLVNQGATRTARNLALLGVIFLGWAVWEVWDSSKADLVSPLDSGSLIVAMAALFYAIGLWAECNKAKNDPGSSSFCGSFQIYLLLAISAMAVVAFRYYFFQESNALYGDWFATTFTRPRTGVTPAWTDRDGYIATIAMGFRANFWAGFSTGIVASQLLIAQIASVLGGLDHNSAHPRHAATSVSAGRLTGRGRR